MDVWQVLLLDEITVDLDVVARMDLLSFFVDECEEVGHHLIFYFRFPCSRSCAIIQTRSVIH